MYSDLSLVFNRPVAFVSGDTLKPSTTLPKNQDSDEEEVNSDEPPPSNDDEDSSEEEEDDTNELDDSRVPYEDESHDADVSMMEPDTSMMDVDVDNEEEQDPDTSLMPPPRSLGAGSGLGAGLGAGRGGIGSSRGGLGSGGRGGLGSGGRGGLGSGGRGGIGSGAGRGGIGSAKSMFAHFGTPVVQASSAPPSSPSDTPLEAPAPVAETAPKRGGIGSGGIGSSRRAEVPADSSLPSSFSSPAPPARAQRSFVREGHKPGTPAAANLSAEERRHFEKLNNSGGFGAKMMAKMGWTAVRLPFPFPFLLSLFPFDCANLIANVVWGG